MSFRKALLKLTLPSETRPTSKENLTRAQQYKKRYVVTVHHLVLGPAVAAHLLDIAEHGVHVLHLDVHHVPESDQVFGKDRERVGLLGFLRWRRAGCIVSNAPRNKRSQTFQSDFSSLEVRVLGARSERQAQP